MVFRKVRFLPRVQIITNKNNFMENKNNESTYYNISPHKYSSYNEYLYYKWLDDIKDHRINYIKNPNNYECVKNKYTNKEQYINKEIYLNFPT